MGSTEPGPMTGVTSRGATTSGGATAPYSSTAGGTLCELGCANLATCEPVRYEVCLADCEHYFGQIEGFDRCEAAAVELWHCLGTARCDSLGKDCEAEFQAESREKKKGPFHETWHTSTTKRFAAKYTAERAVLDGRCEGLRVVDPGFRRSVYSLAVQDQVSGKMI